LPGPGAWAIGCDGMTTALEIPPGDAGRRRARLEAAFAEEQQRGFELAARVRLVMVACVGIWITIENPFPDFLFFYLYLLLFGVLGYGPSWLRRAGVRGAWVAYLFPFLDMVLLAASVMIPNPLQAQHFPPQMLLRLGNEMYLFLFIAASIFSYSPAAVMWSGVAASLVWSAVTLLMLRLPDSFAILTSSEWAAIPAEDRLGVWLDPQRINVNLWGRQVVLFLVAAAALAVFVRRARRMVERQAEAARERTNLSRYFSPNLVEELAQSDQALGPTRQQDVAVLFADLVGFTTLAETMPPSAVIDVLRGFHGRMAGIVFAHHGTLEKYIGDALMATFGAPRPGQTDATDALRCARAMHAALAAWNAERGATGAAPLHMGIGLNWGPVVIGDIGTEHSLAFAVVGDTVNATQRLERLTRDLGGDIVASDAFIAAVRHEGSADADALLAGFVSGPPQALRGREATMNVWTMKQSAVVE
jgi:adenylate cyclase